MQSFFIVLSTALLTALIAGCSKPSSQDSLNQRGFVYCGASQPTSFNPQLNEGWKGNVFSNQLFDRLLKLDPKTHQPLPMLANEWRISEDGKTYTFNLRDKVNFHQTAWFTPSRPLNAQDVVFSFERILDPDHIFHNISGGHYPWFENSNFAKLVESVYAIDDKTVAFTLSQVDVSFLPSLATTYAAIHSKEYANELVKNGNLENIDSHPVGTGPFIFDEYEHNQFIRLKKHDNYWDGEAIMEQIIFDTTRRGTGNLTKLITKECDVLASPVSSQISVITSNPDYHLSAQTGMNLAFLALNTKHPALAKKEVRHAINLAINRDAIIENVYHGGGKPASSILPPMSWAYDINSRKVYYTPKLASTLLANAGYRQGFSIDLVVPENPKPYNPSPQKTAKMIQSQLGMIGIKVNIITEENINRDQLHQRQNELEMVLTGWIANNGDPNSFLRPHLSCNAINYGWNISNWCHPIFEQKLDEGISTNNKLKRKEIYLTAQSILQEQMPVIPIAHGTQYQAHTKDFQGLTYPPFGDVSFSKAFRSH